MFRDIIGQLCSLRNSTPVIVALELVFAKFHTPRTNPYSSKLTSSEEILMNVKHPQTDFLNYLQLHCQLQALANKGHQ